MIHIRIFISYECVSIYLNSTLSISIVQQNFDCKSCVAQSLTAQNVKHEIADVTSINNICHGLWGVFTFLPLGTATLLLGRVLEFKNFN